MKRTAFTYLVGAGIALGFYLVSQLAGSAINVLAMFASGCRSYSEFINKTDSLPTLLLLLAASIANHVFFAWLTAGAITRLGKKTGCLSRGVFPAAAAVVLVYGIAAIPVLFSGSAGWLTYSMHALCVLAFGNRQLKKLPQPAAPEGTAAPAAGAVRSGGVPEDGVIYCTGCGTKIGRDHRFCPYCGAAVPPESRAEG